VTDGPERSEGWDLYVNPKSKKKDEAQQPKAQGAAQPESKAPDGTDLYVAPKKPRPEAAAPGMASGGAVEMSGSPRPKPKPDAAADADAEFRRQAPESVEEDAEVWDGTKWTTPSGRVEGLAPGAAEIPEVVQAEAGPVVESDEDTEVVVAPKRVLPPETKSPMPRFGNPVQAAKQGKDGRDFQEYTKPLVPPPNAPQSPASSPPMPMPGSAPQPFKPYGASLVPNGSASPTAPPPATAPPDQVHARGLPPGTLNVLLVGSGAREHAMALAIRRSQRAHLFVVMKHRNPGLAKSATGFKLLDERDAAGIVAWARSQKIHLAVTGPESSLEAGVTDALRAAGIAVASPSQAAARIETSKTFMRELMAKHRIPGSLAFHPFTALQPALDFLDRHGPVWAVKPVGLTGGKGVQVHGDHFTDLAGAKAYAMSVFAQKPGGAPGTSAAGAAAPAVQFEELVRGEEFTLMAFTDGTTILPMPAVQDHKRLLEGDKGPNTGGMGSYSQADGLLPFLSAEEYSRAAGILQGIVDALRAEGTPYVGTIYGQFMLTREGPKVIEVNARFGDPEAVNVLHLLESDYVSVLEGMATGTLSGREARFRGAATVVKYLVPKGYGQGSPASGKPVEIDDFNVKRTGGMVYMGAIEQMPYGGLETMASRTVAVLGEGATIEHANAVCEASLRHVHGKDLHVRHDIGSAELIAKRVAHMQELRGGGRERAAQAVL